MLSSIDKYYSENVFPKDYWLGKNLIKIQGLVENCLKQLFLVYNKSQILDFEEN